MESEDTKTLNLLAHSDLHINFASTIRWEEHLQLLFFALIDVTRNIGLDRRFDGPLPTSFHDGVP